MDTWILPVTVLLAIIFGSNEAKSVDTEAKVECMCKISTQTKVLYDLGNIETYTVASGWTKKLCHDARHLCKIDCDKRIRKVVDTPEGKLFTYRNHAQQPYGAEFCKLVGEDAVTPDDGLLVTAQSVATGCGHEWKAGHWKTHLCCGRTSLVRNGKTVRAFGWNSDCHAVAYSIVH